MDREGLTTEKIIKLGNIHGYLRHMPKEDHPRMSASSLFVRKLWVSLAFFSVFALLTFVCCSL
jgi:hypothetical protein